MSFMEIVSYKVNGMNSEDNLRTSSAGNDINSDMSSESSNDNVTPGNDWWTMPEYVLIEILRLLDTRDLLSAGLTCHRWYDISCADVIWIRKFQKKFADQQHIKNINPKAKTWKSEYRRFLMEIPLVESQSIRMHKFIVTHVTFAHNGESFVTCSMDRNLIVWHSQHPCKEKYKSKIICDNLYPKYSQFNENDTLLLVMCENSITDDNEIAIYSIGSKEFLLQYRIPHSPRGLFTGWSSTNQFISGNLSWHENRTSETQLWLNDIDTSTKNLKVKKKLCKFYNSNGGHARYLLVTKSMWLDKYYKMLKDTHEGIGSIFEVSNSIEPRYLIYLMSTMNFTSNRIGIKPIHNKKLPTSVYKLKGASLKKEDNFDHSHRVLDFHGDVVGIALCPDRRYLYVNIRPWPKGYTIIDPLHLPPISKDVEVQVIDLLTLNLCPTKMVCHNEFISTVNSCFIFLEANENYVTIGGEAVKTRLFDRYYGIRLAEYDHAFVTCVALNPRDSGMLVTTGIDHKIKIWRSQDQINQQDDMTFDNLKHNSLKSQNDPSDCVVS